MRVFAAVLLHRFDEEVVSAVLDACGEEVVGVELDARFYS